jgi:hypothetical protein
MRIVRRGICLWAAVLVAFASQCHAQSTVTPEQEYKKLIRVNEEIQPLGANPFGEQVSLYNGGLSFTQTDVSLPGNGPLLQLSRSMHTKPSESVPSNSIDGAFSDWDIDLPRITTTTANLNGGWTVLGTQHSTARCTHFGVPPTVAPVVGQGGSDWEPQTWWDGYHLVVPGAGSQDLLVRGSQNTFHQLWALLPSRS